MITSRLGKSRRRADISLHKPTAQKSDFLLSGVCGLKSKQAISWSNFFDCVTFIATIACGVYTLMLLVQTVYYVIH